MLRMNVQQMLAVLLSLLLIRPVPMSAASAKLPAPAGVLGSITSYGSVYVGEVSAPAESTLFAGDQISTRAGSAVIQYKEGARVLLAKESAANFTTGQIQLQKGQMIFRAVSADGPAFAATTLRLEPLVPKSVAAVSLNDGKANVTVTEGALRVVDPSGTPLVSVKAGQTALLAMASAAAPAPAAAPTAAAAAPQGAGGSNVFLLLSLGVAVVSTSLAIAALVRAGDAEDKVEDLERRLSASPFRP